jgi:hypothetical protein
MDSSLFLGVFFFGKIPLLGFTNFTIMSFFTVDLDML